jgi:hypothetical protein
MKKKLIVLLTILSVLLTGCIYPEKELSKNKVPYLEQISAVQTAVQQFQKDNGGILPIKTKEAATPIYLKYPIDFEKIVPRYMADPPGNAFENGGIFQYVLVNVETTPTVRLVDLRVTDTIREIKMRINANGGYPPYKEELGKNVYSLDYSKLNYKEEPFAVSPYTNVNLPFVVGADGDIYVDYRMDLYKLIKEKKPNLETNSDIRHILVEDSLFVPAYSLPYAFDAETEEPIFYFEGIKNKQ